MHFDRKSYGARIRQLRISKRLTQEQLAEKMHVTGTYIVKIESSQRTGSVELAVELASCFGISLDYLLLGAECNDKKRLLQTVILPLSAAPVFVPSENGYKEKTMQDKNVDFCGILNLLAALKRAGFPKTELEQVAVRIAVQTGATIPISF